MEQSLNLITLTGSLGSAPTYSHSNHGRRFFSFFLEVSRLSGAVDRLPVLAPESLLAQTELGEGDAVRINGQIRSFNNRSTNGRRLVVSVYAETLETIDAPHENCAELQGVICREPVYRRTPLGREICDIMLAVNRPYRRADYIPCILWGRCAQAAAYYPVGTPLHLEGRLQSREYIKQMEDGSTQPRVAYELAAIPAENGEQE